MSNALRTFVAIACIAISSLPASAQAPARLVGVILQGGPWYAMVEGLKVGLKAHGLEEGKHFTLRIRDTAGDLNAVEEAAQAFERDQVALIFTAATSVARTGPAPSGTRPECYVLRCI